MKQQLTNFVDLTDDKLIGNIASLVFDIDFKGEAVQSDNEKAPKYRLFAKSPRGRDIQIGGIWQRLNRDGEPYLTLTVETGHSKFYATLGRYPGQDDEELLSIIPNDYLNNQRN